jgi:hypothetical protein
MLFRLINSTVIILSITFLEKLNSIYKIVSLYYVEISLIEYENSLKLKVSIFIENNEEISP